MYYQIKKADSFTLLQSNGRDMHKLGGPAANVFTILMGPVVAGSNDGTTTAGSTKQPAASTGIIH